ncbi:MAG: hypothetical protein V3S76_03300 [Candidatus Bipolaricaulota bacterium]
MNWMMWIKGPDRQQMKTIGVILLLLCSVTLIIWVSADKFLSIQDSKDQIQATIALEQEISQLRSQYLTANSASLVADLEFADQLLIQSFPHLAQWAQELQQLGKQWDLKMQYRIVKTRQTIAPVEGLTVIPMEFHVIPDKTPNTYRAYLQFLRTLEQSGPRMDIQEVTVTGDGKQATHLTVGLLVWMKTLDSVEL